MQTLNEKYNVNVQVKRGDETYAFDAKISFSYDSETYGNGHHMFVESKEEAFGGQGYDIRYDTDFDEEFLIEYIVAFYSRRYDGKKMQYDTKWKLTGISVTLAD